MPGSLPAFQPASELPPSPSRLQELEELCSRQAAENEGLREIADHQPKAVYKEIVPAWPAQEKAKLLEIISDLDSRLKLVELQAESQAKQIGEQSEKIALLRDGIVRLQNEVASCKQLHDESSSRLAQDIAADRRRIASLEQPKIDTETNRDRAERIAQYTSDNSTPYKFIDRKSGKSVEGRIVKFELLRLHLECDKWQLNRALATLIKLHPGEYCKKKLKKNKWFLVELPKL